MCDPHRLRRQQLRTVIGMITLLLPAILWVSGYTIFGIPWKATVSQYYHHHPGMVGVFVGLLFFNGLSLILYPVRWRRTTTIAGLFALVVALLPEQHGDVPIWVGRVHYLAAATLLGLLAWISGFDFSQKDKDSRWLHILCALTVAVCLILIGVYHLLKLEPVVPWQVFALESISLVAIGASWVRFGDLNSVKTVAFELFDPRQNQPPNNSG